MISDYVIAHEYADEITLAYTAVTHNIIWYHSCIYSAPITR